MRNEVCVLALMQDQVDFLRIVPVYKCDLQGPVNNIQKVKVHTVFNFQILKRLYFIDIKQSLETVLRWQAKVLECVDLFQNFKHVLVRKQYFLNVLLFCEILFQSL